MLPVFPDVFLGVLPIYLTLLLFGYKILFMFILCFISAPLLVYSTSSKLLEAGTGSTEKFARYTWF